MTWSGRSGARRRTWRTVVVRAAGWTPVGCGRSWVWRDPISGLAVPRLTDGLRGTRIAYGRCVVIGESSSAATLSPHFDSPSVDLFRVPLGGHERPRVALVRPPLNHSSTRRRPREPSGRSRVIRGASSRVHRASGSSPSQWRRLPRQIARPWNETPGPIAGSPPYQVSVLRSGVTCEPYASMQAAGWTPGHE